MRRRQQRWRRGGSRSRRGSRSRWTRPPDRPVRCARTPTRSRWTTQATASATRAAPRNPASGASSRFAPRGTVPIRVRRRRRSMASSGRAGPRKPGIGVSIRSARRGTAPVRVRCRKRSMISAIHSAPRSSGSGVSPRSARPATAPASTRLGRRPRSSMDHPHSPRPRDRTDGASTLGPCRRVAARSARPGCSCRSSPSWVRVPPEGTCSGRRTSSDPRWYGTCLRCRSQWWTSPPRPTRTRPPA